MDTWKMYSHIDTVISVTINTNLHMHVNTRYTYIQM